MNRYVLLSILLALLAVTVSAHDYVPGEPQTQPILLQGGNLYTVSDGVLENTDLLFENGRISQIGPNLTPPDNARVIDVTGKHVYPGLINAATTLGLIEIGAVRATNDITEVGSATPEVAAHIAFNCDSELLPTVRAQGVSTALVIPGGNLLRGRSSLMNLDCWTKEDGAEKLIVGMHLSWPSTRVSTAWWMRQTPDEQRKAMKENRRRLQQLFADARSYWQAKQANPNIEKDARWEAMLPLFTKDMPLLVHANYAKQIEEAVAFAQREDLRLILVSGREAYQQLDLIAQHDIPVILHQTYMTPMREDEDYDQGYKNAAMLAERDIRFCIASHASWRSRNLAFDAGMAHAFGLSKEAALRSITLSPAEILGVGEELGSLEIGKKATLFVSEGDVMDHLGHEVTLMFIEGAEVDLDSKHKELYEKYRQRQWSPSN